MEDKLEVGDWAKVDGEGGLITPERLRFSSISKYSECGELWRLTYGYQLEGDSAYWANPGGSAIHEVLEYWQRRHLLGELPLVVPSFEECFEVHRDEYLDAGIMLRESGATRLEMSWAGGPNKRDEEWWKVFGQRMADAGITWRKEQENRTELIATELEFKVRIGRENMTGTIDCVVMDRDTGVIGIEDWKTGTSDPNPIQLGIYREGLEAETGLRASWGRFVKWNQKTEKIEQAMVDENGEPVLLSRGKNKGQPKIEKVSVPGDVYAYATGVIDFAEIDSEYVAFMVNKAREGIEAGIFLPNTRNNCRYCPVKEFCRAQGGNQALLIPITSKITSGLLDG